MSTRLYGFWLSLVLGQTITPCFEKFGCLSTSVFLTQIGDGYCDLECMNALCGFDRSLEGFSDCDSECSAANLCLESQRRDGVCDSECNRAECGFDFGDCLFCDFECLESQINNGICDLSCNTEKCGFDGEDCVEPERHRRLESATTLYVSCSTLPSPQYGTEEFPYLSLSQAFADSNLNTQTIYLLDRIHLLTKISENSLNNNAKLTSPLDHDFFPTQMLVTTLFCTNSTHSECANSAATIRITDFNITLVIKQKVTFQNVNIDGYTEMKKECGDPGCYYCMRIEVNGTVSTDDRGKVVNSSSVVSEKDCEMYSKSLLFDVGSVGILYLTDVIISNIRYQPLSVISLSGKANVFLSNVDFSNIVVSKTGAVIFSQSSCGSFLDCFSLTQVSYKNGIVEYLNNGYEYKDGLEKGVFLTGNSLGRVEIEGVTFRRNLLMRTDNGGILAFKSVSSVNLTNCIFEYNIAGNLITLVNFGVKFDGISGSSDVHISLQGVIFSRNRVDFGVVFVVFDSYMQNIEIHNCTFDYNFDIKASHISVQNKGELTADMTTGSWRAISNTDPTLTYFAPRYINVTQSSFSRNFGQSVITMLNIANINFNDCNFSSNGSTNENSNDAVVLPFQKDPNIYFSSSLSTLVGNCEGLIRIPQCDGVSFDSVSFFQNNCRAGTAGIKIVSTKGYLIISGGRYIENSSGAQYGSVLYLLNTEVLISLTGAEFTSNTNEKPNSEGLVYISNFTTSDISNCLFTGNRMATAACIFANKFQQLKISNSLFKENTATSENGGAMYIDPGNLSKISSFMVSSSQFISNVCLSGGGAVLLIDSGTPSSLITIVFNTVSFVGNTEGFADAAVITTMIRVAPGSSFEDCQFVKNNYASVALYFGFEVGTLLLTRANFTSNKSIKASGIFLLGGELTIKDSWFHNNTSQNMITCDKLDSSKVLKTINCTFIDNQSAVISTQNTAWSDLNSNFIRNNGGAASLSTSSNATLVGTLFRENENKLHGGAVSLWIGSGLTCMHCTFLGNRAKSGGAIYLQQSSSVNISNSLFDSNYANLSGSAIEILTSDTPISTIFNTTFQYNHVGDLGTISILIGAINMTAVQFFNNKCDHATPGISLMSSTIIVDSSVFRYQEGNWGSVLSSSTRSTVVMKNSVFEHGRAIVGGVLNVAQTSVDIVNCSFHNFTTVSAAGFYAINESNLTLKNVEMSNLRADNSAIGFIDGHSLMIASSKFSDFGSDGFAGNALDLLSVTDSVFAYGFGLTGGAISCKQCISVTILRSKFEHNSALQGGAVFLIPGSYSNIRTHQILDTTFTNNTALRGGAVYSDDSSIEYTRCSFVLNIAKFVSDTVNDSGQGGAVTIDCGMMTYCRFEFINCSFDGNKAEVSGGGINWKDVKPNVTNCDFSGNEAVYGANISSFPVAIQQLTNNRILIDQPLNEVASGQSMTQSLLVALVDHYGAIVKIDNSSSAELLPADVKTTIVSGVTKSTAIQGIFNFSEFVITAEPGTITNIRVSTSAIDSSKQNKTNDGVTYTSSISIPAKMRLCGLGESHVGRTCEICEKGKYSLDPNSTSCLSCPSQATCLGNFTMIPKPGYWRARNDTDVFYQCLYSSACVGSPETSNNISLIGYCADGYRGNLCQSCKARYSRTGKDACGKCPEQTTNIVRLVFIMLAVGIIAGVMVATTIRSAHIQKSVSSIYIKILMNYLQIVILTASFNLKWPQLVLELFSTQETAGSFTEQAFSFDCYLQPKEGEQTDIVVYQKLVIMSTIPVFITVISIFAWVIISGYKRRLTIPKNELTAMIVILLFLAHPTLTKFFFSMFPCMSIDRKQYLLQQLDIECWNSQHLFYVCVCALPAIILWVIGVPALCLGLLIQNKRKLSDVSNKIRLGFLFNGYRKKAYFWEFVILYRKIVIICISVFLTTISVPIQALCVLFVLVISTYLQDSIQPYATPELNRMEFKSILCATVTIYCGLFFLTDDLGEETKFVLFAAIVSVNAIFIWYWIRKMFGFYITLAITKVPCLNRKLGNINRVKDGLEEDLYVDPITRNIFQPSRLKSKPLPITSAEIDNLQTMHDLYSLKVSFDNSSAIGNRKRMINADYFNEDTAVLPNSPIGETDLTSEEIDSSFQESAKADHQRFKFFNKSP